MQSRYIQIALFTLSKIIVRKNLVHGILSAVKNFINPFGRIFGRNKFMNSHGFRVIHIKT
jgi:hypothetical protein